MYVYRFFRYDSLLLEKEDLERALEEMQQEMTDNCESDEGVIGLRNLVRRLEVTNKFTFNITITPLHPRNQP